MPIIVGPGTTPPPPPPGDAPGQYETDALVEEIYGALSGYALDQETITWLTAPIAADQIAFQVADPAKLGVGIAEIGEELVYVAESTPSGVTLPPFGRGYQGTQAAIWAENTRITRSPRFPRVRIRQLINEVVLGTWPTLFAVGHTTVDPSVVKVAYELPDDAEDVFTVKQGIVGPDPLFERTLTRWSFNKAEKTLDVNEGVDPARPLSVSYMRRPQALAPGSAFSDSGLQSRAWPVIKNGVMAQIIAPLEAGLVGVHDAEAESQRERTRISPTTLARQYFSWYQQLITEERSRLLAETEITNNEEYI